MIRIAWLRWCGVREERGGGVREERGGGAREERGEDDADEIKLRTGKTGV